MQGPHLISVSAPLTSANVTSIVDGSREAGLGNGRTSHVGAAGFCVDERTVNGALPSSPRKVSDRALLIELVTQARDGGIVPTMHFDARDYEKGNPVGKRIRDLICFYHQHWVSGIGTLLADAKGACDTFQLNGIPTTDSLKKLRDGHPTVNFIYPIQREQVAAEDLLDSLGAFDEAGRIDVFSFDPSGGAGQTFTADDAARIYTMLTTNFPQARVSFAGGFSDTNVFSRVMDIRRAIGGTNQIGIDAEGQLRDKPSDALNHQKARSFLKNGALSMEATFA